MCLIDSVLKNLVIATTFCTLCCHRYLQHRNVIILGVGSTHILFSDKIVICVSLTNIIMGMLYKYSY